MSAENAALLRKMLQQVVEEGTAQDAAWLEEGAGGKTGTAQTGQFTPDGTERKNLWFAGFYPAQQPRYTIVVLQDGQVSTEFQRRHLCPAVRNAGPSGIKMHGFCLLFCACYATIYLYFCVVFVELK